MARPGLEGLGIVLGVGQFRTKTKCGWVQAVGDLDVSKLSSSDGCSQRSLQRIGVETQRVADVGGFTEGRRRFLDFHRDQGGAPARCLSIEQLFGAAALRLPTVRRLCRRCQPAWEVALSGTGT